MAPLTLEQELGSAAEQVLAKLLAVWKAKEGSPVEIIYSALVDTYVLGANHKTESQLPRVKGEGWHYSTLFVRLPEPNLIDDMKELFVLPHLDEIKLREVLTFTPGTGKPEQ